MPLFKSSAARFGRLTTIRTCLSACLVVASLAIGSTASASAFTFNTDPFAGTTALTTPGRQVIGGETFITFDPATDFFSLDPNVFGVGNKVLFANTQAQNLPSTGLNVIVLESFDDDNNLLTPFGAGSAANLIAQQVNTPGPGFFVYFNQGLNLPRLVFSTDLSDNTADLKVLARMTNLTGPPGRDALQTFTTTNFGLPDRAAPVPEPPHSC